MFVVLLFCGCCCCCIEVCCVFYFWTFVKYEWCFGLCWIQNTSYYNTTLPYYWYWWICLFRRAFFVGKFLICSTQNGTVYLLNKITKQKMFNDSLKKTNFRSFQQISIGKYEKNQHKNQYFKSNLEYWSLFYFVDDKVYNLLQKGYVIQ